FPDSRWGTSGKSSYFAVEEIPIYNDKDEDYIHNRIGAFLADFNGDYHLYLLGEEIDSERLEKIDTDACIRARELLKLREDNKKTEEKKLREEAEQRRRESELKQLELLKAKYGQL